MRKLYKECETYYRDNIEAFQPATVNKVKFDLVDGQGIDMGSVKKRKQGLESQ